MREGPGTLPTSIPLECPTCGEERDHVVLKGTIGMRSQYTLDARVRCETCGMTRHVVHREPGEREVPVVISRGAVSRRTRLLLGDDEDVGVGEELLVDGVRTIVTGIEDAQGLRVDAASVPEVGTLWVKENEILRVGFAINMGKKTISRDMETEPETLFTVGEEYTFDMLRVTVHSIKTTTRLLRRGTAEAGEIARVFAKPTRDRPEPSRPRRSLSREEQMKAARREKKKQNDLRARAGDRNARAAESRPGPSGPRARAPGPRPADGQGRRPTAGDRRADRAGRPRNRNNKP